MCYAAVKCGQVAEEFEAKHAERRRVLVLQAASNIQSVITRVNASPSPSALELSALAAALNQLFELAQVGMLANVFTYSIKAYRALCHVGISI